MREWAALKVVGLTAEETLRRKAVSVRVRRFDEKQKGKTAFLWSNARFFERRAASHSRADSSEKNEGEKREKTGSIGSGSGESSSEKSERNCNRKK